MHTTTIDESQSVTLCNSDSLTLTIPRRWTFDRLNHQQIVAEVDRCAQVLARGTAALADLYLRMCDLVRLSTLTDAEVRRVLLRHFAPPRVSEFLRIARAPETIYHRYRLGFIGFRATLSQCRGYRIHTSTYLQERKIRRAAERLIHLLGAGEVRVLGHRVIVE